MLSRTRLVRVIRCADHVDAAPRRSTPLSPFVLSQPPDALSAYEGLLSDLDDARRGEVARANGQKMKQLKQELAMLGIDLDNPDDHNA